MKLFLHFGEYRGYPSLASITLDGVPLHALDETRIHGECRLFAKFMNALPAFRRDRPVITWTRVHGQPDQISFAGSDRRIDIGVFAELMEAAQSLAGRVAPIPIRIIQSGRVGQEKVERTT